MADKALNPPQINLDRQLVILGAGGHGRVCADIASAMGLRIKGFCDGGKAVGAAVNGIEVIAGGLEELRDTAPCNEAIAFIAVGDNERRQALFEEVAALGYEIAALIHPTAVISPTVTIGAGSVLMPGVIVNANCAIGRACIVNTGASLDHDNHLSDGVQICPGVHAAGNVSFARNAFIGTGAALIPGVSIGANAVVGAGAVVVTDVAANTRVAGNPARPIGSA